MKPLRTPKESLRAGRLLLRQLDLSCAPPLYATLVQEWDRLEGILPDFMRFRGEADAADYIRTALANREAGIGFDYAIFQLEGGQYLGQMGVQNVDPFHRRCEVGFWLSCAFEGSGFATEALNLLVPELFESGFHRIELCCDSENHASLRVAQKAGFFLEGVLRGDRFKDGEFHSTAIWSRLAPSVVAP